jgi:hypothetical protein
LNGVGKLGKGKLLPSARASLTLGLTSAVDHTVLVINGMDVNHNYTANETVVAKYLGNSANN